MLTWIVFCLTVVRSQASLTMLRAAQIHFLSSVGIWDAVKEKGETTKESGFLS